MAEQMVSHMKDLSALNIRGAIRDTADYSPDHKMKLPKWIKGEAA